MEGLQREKKQLGGKSAQQGRDAREAAEAVQVRARMTL